MVRIYLLLFIYFLSVSHSFAKNDSLNLIHFNAENGLPSNNVYSCIQDRNGYMWFATDNGVVKYNGFTFRVFTTSDGLPSNDVWRLYEDATGRMWVLTNAYKFGYIKDDQFHDVLKNDFAITIANINEKDGITFFIERDKLVLIDRNDNVFKVPTLAGHSIIGFDTALYHIKLAATSSILQVRNNKVDIEKVCEYQYDDLRRGSTRLHADNGKIIGHHAKSNLINIINLYNCSDTVIPLVQYGAATDESIYLICKENETKDLCVLTNKNIFYLNAKLAVTKRERIDSIIPSRAQLSYRFNDSFKNGWYTTLTEGVWMKAHTAGVFNKRNELQHLKGTHYAGSTKNGNTYWWKRDGGILYAIDGNLQPVFQAHFSNDVRCVSDSHDGNLYISFPSGLYKYDLRNKQVQDLLYHPPMSHLNEADGGSEPSLELGRDDTLKHYLTSNFSMTQAHGSNVIYTAGALGIIKIELFKDSSRLRKFIFDRLVNIYNDTVNKRLWFYNRGKVLLFNPANDSWITAGPNFFNLLQVNSIAGLSGDGFGNIYVLADKKIVILNMRTLRIKYFYPRFDLTGATMGITGNVLMIASKFGLAYATIQGPLNISGFRIAANPKSVYYNRIYSMAVNNYGNIILNTDNGFYTSGVKDLITDPSLFNANHELFSRIAVSYEGYNAIPKDRDTLYLPPDVSKLKLDLINYYGSGDRTYYYSINDKDGWQQTISGEFFVDIKPNTVRMLRCRVTDDVWNSRTHTFYIEKLPYWWQTRSWQMVFWSVGILLFAGLLLIVVLLTRFFVARSDEKKRSMIELELRALYAQINPHFIFNTLSSALYFIDKNKMEEAYAHVNKFSRLLRAYIKSSRNRYIRLAEEIAMIRQYVELQQTRFEDRFDYEIEVDNKVASESILIPSLLLQPLIENAINHGLFHLKPGEKGLLSLKFLQGRSSDELICVIEDNGVGRERAKQIKKDNVADDESYGTTLTKKLIDIFKEYEKMDIYLEYIDKQAPESGTTVKLTIGNVKYVA